MKPGGQCEFLPSPLTQTSPHTCTHTFFFACMHTNHAPPMNSKAVIFPNSAKLSICLNPNLKVCDMCRLSVPHMCVYVCVWEKTADRHIEQVFTCPQTRRKDWEALILFCQYYCTQQCSGKKGREKVFIHFISSTAIKVKV